MKKKRSVIVFLMLVLGPITYQFTKDIFLIGVKDGKAHHNHKKQLP